MSEEETLPPLTLSVAGSPARMSRTLTQEAKDSTVIGRGFGLNTPELLASFDRSSLSWRTSQLLLMTDSTECLDRLPSSGTMLNGRLYQRAPWVPHIHESACSSVPTPTASDFRGGRTKETSEKVGRGPKNNYRDFCRQILGLRYPSPELTEWHMGFPIGWSEVEPLETQSSLNAPE